MSAMTYYKVLGEDGAAVNGGRGVWHLPHGNRPGKWMPLVHDIEPCRSGYHLCRRGDLVRWLGPTIWVAEGRGATVEADDKVVFAQARLLSRVGAWNETTARLFAADCAERVLPIFERERSNDDRPRQAIAAARSYARGEIGAAARDAARDAARAAAWAAARDAARVSAWAAVRDAARDAVRDAAWDAAQAAARDVAWAAPQDAARAAAWAWQTDRLFDYLEGRAS